MKVKEKETQVVGRKSFTAVAINCASKAGEWIKSKLGGYEQLQLKYSSSDLVTEVDKGSEQLIRKLISTHFPEHSFLGEEGVEAGHLASAKAIAELQDEEYLWIVDPIDGTTNFVHGFPFFCVSIALAHKGEIIVGVVYDPIRDEMFVAEKGKGAYMHGKRLSVSGDPTLQESLIATGFPADQQEALPLNLQSIVHMAPLVRNINAAGAAALHLAYVAAGRLTGFWEMNLNSWDIAAGMLIIQESGGKLTDIEGNPYHLGVRHCVASNGHIHDEFIQQLQKSLQK